MKQKLQGLVVVYFLSILFFSCHSSSQDKNVKQTTMVSPTVMLNSQKVIPIPIPDKLYFANEEVPLNDPEIRERLERELNVNVYKHNSTLQILRRVGRFKAQMTEILKLEGLHEDFFYIAAIESELDPYADSGKARGFWQFTDDTAKDYKLEVSEFVDMRVDPISSTMAACKYFKKAYSEFNNWTLAAAAYNPGINNIRKLKEAQGVNSYYDMYLYAETYRYMFRVLAIKLIIENPEAYGFYISDSDVFKPLKSKVVKVNATIPDLAKFALENKINFKILKQYNPWIRFNRYEYRFEVGPGKEYSFLLPDN